MMVKNEGVLSLFLTLYIDALVMKTQGITTIDD